jgi:hypothetical protein
MDEYTSIKLNYRIMQKYLRKYTVMRVWYANQKQYLGTSTKTVLRYKVCAELMGFYNSKIEKYSLLEYLPIFPTLCGAGVSNEQYYSDIKLYHRNILQKWVNNYQMIIRDYKKMKYKCIHDARALAKSKIVNDIIKWQTDELTDFYMAIRSQLKVVYQEPKEDRIMVRIHCNMQSQMQSQSQMHTQMQPPNNDSEEDSDNFNYDDDDDEDDDERIHVQNLHINAQSY